MVRAKMKCIAIEEWNGTGNGKMIKLQPVIYGSSENERFFRLTPGGETILATVNEEAAKEFELNAEYYVDFTLATAAPKP